MLLKSDNKKNDASKTPKISKQIIASPTLNSRFISPKLKKKKSLKEGNILHIYSGIDNKPTDIPIDDKKKKDKKCEDKDENKNEENNFINNDDDIESKRPHRRNRIKLDNLSDKTPEISQNILTYGENQIPRKSRKRKR